MLDLDPPPSHPVLACAQSIHRALDEITDTDPMYMRTTDKADALRALGRAAARIDATRLALLSASDDVAEVTAARPAGAWAAHELRLPPAQGRRDQSLADALHQRYPDLAAGLRAGIVQRQQADVIVGTLDDLPGDLDPDVRRRAEHHLVALAADFAPAHLRELGARILTIVAPEIAEERERCKLEDAEATAAAETRASLRRRGDGTHDFRARISDAAAARLSGYLEAFINPRHPDHRDPEHTDASSSTTGAPTHIAWDTPSRPSSSRATRTGSPCTAATPPP